MINFYERYSLGSKNRVVYINPYTRDMYSCNYTLNFRCVDKGVERVKVVWYNEYAVILESGYIVYKYNKESSAIIQDIETFKQELVSGKKYTSICGEYTLEINVGCTSYDMLYILTKNKLSMLCSRTELETYQGAPFFDIEKYGFDVIDGGVYSGGRRIFNTKSMFGHMPIEETRQRILKVCDDAISYLQDRDALM